VERLWTSRARLAWDGVGRAPFGGKYGERLCCARGCLGCFFISGIPRTTDPQSPLHQPAPAGEAVWEVGGPNGGGLAPACWAAGVGRESSVSGYLGPWWGPLGAKEASVILKTSVYSFVCKASLLNLFHRGDKEG
jgi:hypothetical protein